MLSREDNDVPRLSILSCHVTSSRVYWEPTTPQPALQFTNPSYCDKPLFLLIIKALFLGKITAIALHQKSDEKFDNQSEVIYDQIT